MITIAIAEDNYNERRLLKQEIALNPNYKLVVEAEDGKDLFFQLQKAKKTPDILLLDIKMPFVNGLTATTYITRKYDSIKIIGVSCHTNANLIKEVVSEGALGFISKYFLSKDSIIYKDHLQGMDLLGDAIKDVLQGRCYIDKLVINDPEALGFSLSTQSIIEKKYQFLKPELIEFLILNSTGLLYKEIAGLMCISLAMVKKYYEKLSLQFAVATREELSLFCMQHGIIKLACYYDSTMVA